MEAVMKTLAIVTAAALIGGAVVARADTAPLAAVPGDAVTVTDYYKQNVYDTANNKIGEVRDVLVDASGKVAAFIVGVGGLLGAGERDVAVPFDAIKATEQNGKVTLAMNSTADQLKNAPAFKYDSNSTKWVPANK